MMKNEDVAVALCKCLCQLLNLGADPNILVRDKPIAHYFFQNADYHTLSYTAFWPLLYDLCRSTRPDLRDCSGNTALHCVVLGRANAGTRTNGLVLERMRSAIQLLLHHSRERGMVNSCNNHSRTALQLLVENWTAADDEFWRISRDFVWAGADTHGLIPEDFAQRLRKLSRSKHAGGSDYLHELADGSVPLPVVVWLSACEQLSSVRHQNETLPEHLAALESCAGHLGVRIAALESLLRSS